jgi:hypothetical protein
MAGYRAALLNFSKGVISPELEARFDLQAYQAGARQATNVKIRRTGGLSKRMGTRFVTEALSENARLLPFQFSDEQGYALEFGQAYMRPLALGGAILEEGLRVTAITKAAQAKITAAYHGYLVGEQVYLKSDDPATFGMHEILDRWLTIVSVQDADNFTVDIDSTGFSDFDTDTGTVRVGAPPAPPADPPVPPPATPPEEPEVGSGSGGGYESGGGGGVYWKGGDYVF